MCMSWQRHSLTSCHQLIVFFLSFVWLITFEITFNSAAYYTHTHTHPFNGPLSWTTRVSRHQKGKTNLHFTETRDSEWQWHPLGHMQVCTSVQTDNHASTPPLSFLQAGCPSCRPTNSVRALKACLLNVYKLHITLIWIFANERGLAGCLITTQFCLPYRTKKKLVEKNLEKYNR